MTKQITVDAIANEGVFNFYIIENNLTEICFTNVYKRVINIIRSFIILDTFLRVRAYL